MRISIIIWIFHLYGDVMDMIEIELPTYSIVFLVMHWMGISNNIRSICVIFCFLFLLVMKYIFSSFIGSLAMHFYSLPVFILFFYQSYSCLLRRWIKSWWLAYIHHSLFALKVYSITTRYKFFCRQFGMTRGKVKEEYAGETILLKTFFLLFLMGGNYNVMVNRFCFRIHDSNSNCNTNDQLWLCGVIKA